MSDEKDDDKEFTISFAPGAFENIDITQEELDDLINSIKGMIADGSFFENSKPVDFDDLPEKVRKDLDDYFDGKEPTIN